MPHFEFTIEGPPLSHQTRDRERLKRWRDAVRAAAAARWSAAGPWTEALSIQLTYFHEGPDVFLDNDNLIKPIQDALNGLIYVDDRQITDTEIRKTPVDGLFYVRGASMVLLEGFAHGAEFLHIIVRSAPGHERFLE